MSITGNRIRSQRISLGLTQDELAHKMGYTSRTTINKIELGKNDIPLSKVEMFARVLECSTDYLMGWSDQTITAKDLYFKYLEEIKLIDRYKEADEATQTVVRRLLGCNEHFEKI